MKKYIAEFIGTFWLVFGGCGSAVFAAAVPTGDNNQLGIGFLGVSLAFGLTVFTGAYALGQFSGGHFNPAVSFGLWMGKRFRGGDLAPYIIAQVLGGIVASLVLWIILGSIDVSGSNPFATNGFGDHSPGGYGFLSVAIAEFVLTFIFLVVILGTTSPNAPVNFAGAAIGLCLTLIHLISIPISNTSVNPARSTGPALVVALNGNVELLAQVPIFWIAPIAGALLAGFVYTTFLEEKTTTTSDAE
ncbi:MAG: aquaporin Z [Synechococcaceae cyanobacterium RL_1_2]|nr:aquaporin Z [Synechococcaceae cyanobacterium RL_1_2]